MSTAQVLGLFNYWVVIFLMMTGFYMVIARHNFIKKVIGINIFQIAVILMYITMGKVDGGTAPIVKSEIAQHFAHHDDHGSHGSDGSHETAANATETSAENSTKDPEEKPFVDTTIYTNPLPSVLMLTAIVVGIGTTAVALSLIVRVREEYGTIEEDEALAMDRGEPR
ncbi:MAG: cation:proton antiporter subunit C [Pirellula sp.]|jgi:multicomponent Na+:H+ antiporter subunit C|nr:cation:proton antiporter subunit C [Pirellula sp.]